jgi:branched-chain amino acid transport system ATP-binding protein
MSALLEVEGLTKRFSGVTAVSDVSFTVGPGEITGVLGPNGAGKTTLFNLLTGFLRSDAGAARFEQRSILGVAPHAIVQRGVARTFQLCRPFHGMTVRENVAVGCFARRAHAGGALEERVQAILGQVGLSAKADQPVETLPYGDLRRLEIARALATRPKLLLLDEPFAGLGAGEILPLVHLIRRLHDSEGLTILIIEHKLREFMQLVSRVIAMDFGEIIATGTPAEIVRHPKVVESYIGKAAHGIA